MSSSCDSVESFPGSRNNSRTAERDWDNGSTASSITSMAEYSGQYTDFVVSHIQLHDVIVFLLYSCVIENVPTNDHLGKVNPVRFSGISLHHFVA